MYFRVWSAYRLPIFLCQRSWMTALTSEIFFHYNFSICSGLKNVWKRKQRKFKPCVLFKHSVLASLWVCRLLSASLSFLANDLISSRFLITSNMPENIYWSCRKASHASLVFTSFWPTISSFSSPRPKNKKQKNKNKPLGKLRLALGCKRHAPPCSQAHSTPGNEGTGQSLKALWSICPGWADLVFLP